MEIFSSFRVKVFSFAIKVIFFLLILKTPVLSNDSNICEDTAKQVERSAALPENMLTSISVVEAGRRHNDGTFKSWPWSLNHAGKSLFFSSKLDAVKYLKKNISNDFKNIDVGCMQINVKWHFENFLSFGDMLDPQKNINYAAKFLKKLKKQHGSWEEAIKHYHSATPSLNLKYFAKVDRTWKTKNKATSIDALFVDNGIFFKKDGTNNTSQAVVLKNETIVENDDSVVKFTKWKQDFNENKISFNSSFSKHGKFNSDESFRKYMKYKSAYLRKNVDMILFFREEFSSD